MQASISKHGLFVELTLKDRLILLPSLAAVNVYFFLFSCATQLDERVSVHPLHIVLTGMRDL